jgi:hypothetical protein
MKAGGVRYKRVEPLGGVFEPVPGRQSAPAWSFGPMKDGLYQCPVSAIPSACWSLLNLWMQCQGMGALPYDGGVLAQPLITRRVFPIFADEFSRMKMAQDNAGASTTGATAAAAVLSAVFGGKR